tara:strand:+ start:953 stop:1804 length:852 start_codon:yes stop_codon:yes gene_type:complete
MKLQELQEKFLAIRSNKLFEIFVVFVILLSALVIGVKTYDISHMAFEAIAILDFLITLFFLLEIIIRMIAEGSLRRFFKKGWNVFDFTIVVLSLLPIQDSEMALLGRLLRVFRVLRLISIIPELRVLVEAFLAAIPRMGYIALLMFIVFYIYGAMGSMFFSDINQDLWGNISISMLTLFRVATFEDWTDVMYETMEIYPLSWIFYISFIFIIAFVFLNMMIGVVLDTLQRENLAVQKTVAYSETGLENADIKNRTSLEKIDELESLVLDLRKSVQSEKNQKKR